MTADVGFVAGRAGSAETGGRISARRESARAAIPVLACAAAVELCWLGVLALGDLRQQLAAFVALFLLAFVAYLVASWLALSGRSAAPTVLIVGGAVLFRLTMLPAPPTLSDDLYRSVWEGRILAAGFSPYRYPPDAVELESHRDEVWIGVNNKSVPSPYPPLAQLYSVATYAISPQGHFGPKVLSTALDLAIVATLLLWLRSGGRREERLILYAWAPLPVLEFTHSGHNDALMILLLIAALALHRRPILGPVTLAAATLAKIVPVLVAPLLVPHWGARGTALFAGLVVLGYAPLIGLGGGAVGSLPVYAATWSDNDSLYFLLRALLGLFLVDPAPAAKLASVAILALGVALLALHPVARGWPLTRRTLIVLGLFLALSSTVHTWYLAWLLPLLALELEPAETPLVFRPLWAYGWLVLSGLAVLPYLTYADHVWQVWISVAEYVPLYALIVLGLWAARRRSVEPSTRLAP
jgi:alpha-1,6-mannosyltransferase